MGMPLADFVEQAWPGVRDQREHDVIGKALPPPGFFERCEMDRINTMTEALDKIFGPA